MSYFFLPKLELAFSARYVFAQVGGKRRMLLLLKRSFKRKAKAHISSKLRLVLILPLIVVKPRSVLMQSCGKEPSLSMSCQIDDVYLFTESGGLTLTGDYWDWLGRRGRAVDRLLLDQWRVVEADFLREMLAASRQTRRRCRY